MSSPSSSSSIVELNLILEIGVLTSFVQAVGKLQMKIRENINLPRKIMQSVALIIFLFLVLIESPCIWPGK